MERPPFDRERFLLSLVGFILVVQFGIFVIAAGVCTFGFYKKLKLIQTPSEPIPICPTVLEHVNDSVSQAAGILLALLGGGAVAVTEINRRKPPDPPDDPNSRLP